LGEQTEVKVAGRRGALLKKKKEGQGVDEEEVEWGPG